MDRSRECNTPGLTVRITYTAYNFEHCKHTLVEYSNDLFIQNRAMGTEITRKAVELAFKANVEDIYAEGSVMRQELLEQLNCPCVSNYWEKRLRPAAFLVYMRNDVTPYGFLPRSSSDISRRIYAMLEDDNTRIELPYLGLRDLRQLRYMDIVSDIRISRLGRDAGIAPEPTMTHVWKTVVMNIFWFEDSELKQEKLAEAYTAEVRRYWKLIEYADFVKLNPLARHVAPIDGGKNPEKVYGNELLIPAIAHSQSRVQSDTRPVESGMTASAASGRQPTAWKDLGYFPSIAAHSAHAQPHVFEDNSENSRLRKAVIEHKATIRDLSARLVKAKVSEAQNRKHSAREARGSHIKAQRQESDVAAKVQPQASSATKLSIPNKHNQDLKLEKTVPPIPHPFDSGPLLTPSREDVQHVQRMEQWQSLPDVLQRQLEQRPSWPEQQLEQRYMHAFDTQLAQVDWQRRGDWNDLS